MSSPRRSAPAVARNREPILAVLRRVLPVTGTVLEISSGTGEHAVFFAAAFPDTLWQPSDLDPAALETIEAYRSDAGLANLRPAIPLDASSRDWPLDRADAIVCINMIHISPWSACEGLMAGAARLLPVGGTLFLYGPYKQDGHHTADSNRAFDEDLRRRNPAWGIRNVEDVIALATRHGLVPIETVAMPANNLSVVFRKIAPA